MGANKFLTLLNRALCAALVLALVLCPSLALAAAGVLCSLTSALVSVLVGVVALPLTLCCAYPQALAVAATLALLAMSERRVWA